MLLGALCWLSTGMAAQAAGDGARYDFTNGIPADFTLIDADGNTPSADIAPYGFSVGRRGWPITWKASRTMWPQAHRGMPKAAFLTTG